MIRTILFFFVIGFLAVITFPVALYARFIAKDGRAVVQTMLNLLWGIIMKVSGTTCEATGLENMPEGPALYVGNHQSIFDIFVMLTNMGPAKPFIAKKELGKLPIAHLWLEALGCIYIDRKNLRASLETMKKAEEMLKNGQSLVVFPEGTRSKGPDMGEFKPGAMRCAVKAEVPIVPFALDNCYKAFEETGKIKPAQIKLAVLPPIDAAGSGLKTDKLSELAKEHIQAKLDELRA